MLTVTDSVKELFLKNYRQVARITMTHPGVLGQRVITEADIMQGGLTIDKYCTTNGRLDIGTLIAAQLSLRLKNTDNKFGSYKFLNAELFVEIGIKKWDAYEWENAQVTYIPMGVYVVTTPVRTNTDIITITALDRTVYLNQKLTSSVPDTVTKLGELLEYVCGLAGVTCASGVSSISQYNSEIDVSTITRVLPFRTIVQWVAFTSGTCAFFNNEGYLTFKEYKNTIPTTTPDFEITKDDRYSVDIDNSRDYILGGSQVIRSDGSAIAEILWGYPAMLPYYDEKWYVVSTGEIMNHWGIQISNEVQKAGVYYVNTMHDCQLYESESVILTPTQIKGIKSYPCEAKIKSMPWIELMDLCRLKKVGNTNYDVYITHISFTMNGAMHIACDMDPITLSEEGVYVPTPTGIVI